MSHRKKINTPSNKPSVALSRKNQALDGSFVDHKKYVNLYRHHTMRVIKDVRRGVVNETDMDKLQNFVQMALALMDRSTVQDIDKAWRNSEAMSFIHADLELEIVENPDTKSEDYACVLDPLVQSSVAEVATHE